MPKGPSGKIVVDLGVELKRSLHSKLALKGKTVKKWAIEAAEKETTTLLDPSAGSGDFLTDPKLPTK